MEVLDLHKQILGNSINSQEVKFYIDKFELKIEEKRDLSVNYVNKEKGINLDFEKKRRFEKEYGKPKSVITNDESELISTTLTFEKKLVFDTELPYDLKIGDNVDEINQKIGKKPFEKRKSFSYDIVEYNYYYNVDDQKILIKLDENMKFAWIRFWLISKSEKYLSELKKSLAKQDKNIVNYNIGIIKNLKSKTPSKDWEIRMLVGDDMFTKKDIEFAQKTLEIFIDNICEATNKKKASKIYSSIKKITLTFNINNNFIETLEREELVNFIHETVKLTGFEIEDKSDLTEEWREW